MKTARRLFACTSLVVGVSGVLAVAPVPEDQILCGVEAVYVVRLSEALCVGFNSMASIGISEAERRQRCTEIVFQGKIDEVLAGESVQVGQFVSQRLGQPRAMIDARQADYWNLIGARVILTKKGFGYPLLMKQYKWARDTLAQRCPHRLRAPGAAPAR